MKRICVYCGSSPGAIHEYRTAARELGQELVSRELGLVYGGGSVGVMGEISNAVLEAGGSVTGVIPEAMVDWDVANSHVSDLRVVQSMHERKQLMAELADGFVALPGGLGTFEEFFEVLTWAQLGLHRKPCGLLNVCDYFRGLIDFLDHAVVEQFVAPDHRSLVLVSESAVELLDEFDTYIPPILDKAAWAKRLNAEG